MKIKNIVFDCETKCDLDLNKVGRVKYLNHPSADIVCISYADIDNPDKVHLWKPGLKIPKFFINPDPKSYHFYALNALFDLSVVNIVGRRRYGFGIIGLSQTTDVMGLLGRYGYPLGLDQAAKALQLVDLKDPKGKFLMKKVCSPPYKYTKQEYSDFLLYCIQDTKVTLSILHSLPTKRLSSNEQRIWEQTARLNLKGLPIDVAAITRINQVVRHHTHKRSMALPHLTNNYITAPTQSVAMLRWVNRQIDVNNPLPDLTAVTVEDALENRTDLPPKVREVLKIRKELGGSAVKKYIRLEDMAYKGKIHDNLIYYGAATGRFAGRGFQLHNLPRASVENPDDEIQKFYDTTILEEPERILEIAKALIRPMVRAPKGKLLLVADYSSIEYVLLMWWANETRWLNSFKQGRDPYKEMAASLFNVPYEEVTKDQRKKSKPVVLGAGYVLSAKGHKNYAESFGIILSDQEAAQQISHYRRSRRKVVSSWNKLSQAATNAIIYKGDTYTVNETEFKVVGHGKTWLQIKLPSKRSVFYAEPHLREGRYGSTPAYWGVDSYTKKWKPKYLSTSRLVENIIQALARDYLCEGCRLLEEHGYKLLGHVHDEVILEISPNQSKELDAVLKLMCPSKPWGVSRSIPMRAEGFVTKRYRKD